MGMKKGLLKTDVTLRVLYECRRADSNRYGISPTASLGQRVYQFHHFGVYIYHSIYVGININYSVVVAGRVS